MSEENVITDGINAVFSHGMDHAMEMMADSHEKMIPAVLVWDIDGNKTVQVCMSGDPIELGEKICQQEISRCTAYVFVFTAVVRDEQPAVILKIFDFGSEYLVDIAVLYT